MSAAPSLALRHGTISTYTNRRCRCDDCREAARVYQRLRTGRDPNQRRKSQWLHGTQYAYNRKRCRCEVCAAAARLVWEERRRAAGMLPREERYGSPQPVVAREPRPTKAKPAPKPKLRIVQSAPRPAPKPDTSRPFVQLPGVHYHRFNLGEQSGPIATATCSCGITKRWGTSEAAVAELGGRAFSYGTEPKRRRK